jgi:Antibiotic biosynthesis monooxygenase
MPVIVVTRLRLSDPALFGEFFAAAVAVTEQAKNSDGNLGADVLADANNVFWTRTAWRARSPMQAFVGSEPHLATMARLDDWCDEATFADWEQTSPDLPDWQTSYGHLIADGTVASLAHASDAHETRAFPPPVRAS